MKITNFGTDGLPQPLGAWSTGVVSTASNALFSSAASNTLAVNGVTVTGAAASNYHILASSSTAATWVPDAGGGGTVSAGSNSTRVREVSTAGASTTLWSPFDHAHDGIGTITASSSNTMQRGTWNLRPGVGIALSLTDTDGDGEFDTATIVNTGVPGPAGGGSGGASQVDLVRLYAQAVGSTASLAISITAAASGTRIVVVVASFGRDVNTPSCTNVTFTEVLAVAFSTTIYLSVFVGVVSGTSGATVTVTATGVNYIIADIYVVNDALTPTAGTSATLTNTDAAAVAGSPIGPITVAQGTFFVMAAAQADGTTSLSAIAANAPTISTPRAANVALISGIGRTAAAGVSAFYTGGTSSADLASGIVAVT